MSLESIKSNLVVFHKTRDFDVFFSENLRNNADLQDLIEISLDSSDQVCCIMGSWICTHLVEKERLVFQLEHHRIIHFIEKDTHQSSLRNWMKILSFLDIDEDLHALVIDLCCQFISHNSNKVALQVYSMYTLVPLMRLYPELLPEIEALIQLHSVHKSPAFFAAYRNFKKKIKKIS